MGCLYSGENFSASLNRGTIRVDVKKSTQDPVSLFGLAERKNPKRAFLFVSKVLGRHIPVKPSVMSASYQQLVDQIPKDLPGPVLVFGMAETAVGLGAGVHRSLYQEREDIVYVSSTRHPIDHDLFARFEEEHSHASTHLVYLPSDPSAREMMLNAKSIVMVDDEASTGNTFINLFKSLRDAGLNKIEQIVTCVLTDWSGGAVERLIDIPVRSVSLLSGGYCFDEVKDAPFPEMPNVGVIKSGAYPINGDSQWGRLGIISTSNTFAPDVNVVEGDRILVIGTGEFVWPPFLLAERLEKAGAEVFFSSTSRSPIALGHAIKHAISFSDNYGLGIPNFLYNVEPGLFDRVIICTETGFVSNELVSMLNAEVVTYD